MAGEPQVHGFEEELDVQVFLFIGPIVMSLWGVGVKYNAMTGHLNI